MINRLSIVDQTISVTIPAGDRFAVATAVALPEQLRGRFVYGFYVKWRHNYFTAGGTFPEIFCVYPAMGFSGGEDLAGGNAIYQPFTLSVEPREVAGSGVNNVQLRAGIQGILTADLVVTADITIFYSNTSLGRVYPIDLQNMLISQSLVNG